MAGRSEAEAGAVVAAYDFGGFASLVDVGGGRGILLACDPAPAPPLRGDARRSARPRSRRARD